MGSNLVTKDLLRPRRLSGHRGQCAAHTGADPEYPGREVRWPLRNATATPKRSASDISSCTPAPSPTCWTSAATGDQVLPYYVTPFTEANRVAGPAFTGQGYPCAGTENDDSQTRLRHAGQHHTGHGIRVGVRRQHGVRALGRDHVHGGARARLHGSGHRRRRPRPGLHQCDAVSGIRAVQILGELDRPLGYQGVSASPIRIGETVIHPGDFVFGDIDGVVVVPKDITLDILIGAEDVYERESGMREELRRGVSVKEAYSKYGSL